MLEQFFKQVSLRFRSENDLSDITWALAESNYTFQKLFINFFFEEIGDFDKIILFKREYSEDFSRPDFFIKIDTLDYIIECKINDRNHHFEQYKLQFPQARFGYITNYPINKNIPEFEIREWQQFKIYLESALRSENNSETIILIKGYLEYLTNVCGIFNLKKMNLTNLTSLYQFNHLIKKVICSIEDHETAIHYQSKPFDIERSGQYFSLKKGDGPTIWPWLGVYYAERVCIYLEINQKWCPQIFDKISPEQFSNGGTFYKAPYKDEEFTPSICFELRQEYFDLFNHESSNVNEQEKIIKDFVAEVLMSLGIYLYN